MAATRVQQNRGRQGRDADRADMVLGEVGLRVDERVSEREVKVEREHCVIGDRAKVRVLEDGGHPRARRVAHPTPGAGILLDKALGRYQVQRDKMRGEYNVVDGAAEHEAAGKQGGSSRANSPAVMSRALIRETLRKFGSECVHSKRMYLDGCCRISLNRINVMTTNKDARSERMAGTK
jgi:hypothetical protein